MRMAMATLGLLLVGGCGASTETDQATDTRADEAGTLDAGTNTADTGGTDTSGTDTGESAAGCFVSDDGSSTGAGRYTASSLELVSGTDGATVWYPAEIADSPCTFSVIGWGNGTSSTGGEAYPEYFDRLASHGFVVAVAHTNFAANGPIVLDTAALVLASNDDPQSIFFGKLETQYGVMGKSQGAIAASRDVNTDDDAIAAVLVSGAVGSVTKPALFATSDGDFLRDNTFTGYEGATSTAVFSEAPGGVTHLELDDHVPTAQLATSFLRCHLQQDPVACDYVACAECQVESWTDYLVK